MFVQLRLLLPIALAVLATSLAATAFAESVEVLVQSGRTFVGSVDAKTSDEVLWLRSDYPGGTVRRPIQWRRVVKVSQHGRPLSQAEAMALAADPADARQVAALAPRAPVAKATKPRPIASFDFDAAVGNWDADVSADGVELRVFSYDQSGELMPARGTLQVELWADGREPNTGHFVQSLGRWTVQLEPEAVGPAGAVYRLPFQAVQPEAAAGVYPRGLLHVRLTVPGSGQFDRSLANIRLWPYSAFRDRLEQDSGRRYLPFEGASAP